MMRNRSRLMQERAGGQLHAGSCRRFDDSQDDEEDVRSVCHYESSRSNQIIGSKCALPSGRL